MHTKFIGIKFSWESKGRVAKVSCPAPTCKNETRSPTYTINKNKFRMDKRLNISHNTIKVLEENIGRKISDIPCSNILTDTSPKAGDIKERRNK